MKSKMLIKIIFFTLITVSVVAQKAITITGFNHLESVVTDGEFLYVSDIGKDFAINGLDGDGKILKLKKNGTVVDDSFAKLSLDAPKGLQIYKGILFINDVSRFIAVNLKDGKLLYSIDLRQHTSFLNDIAVWDETTVFVSASDVNKIFKIDLLSKTYSELNTDFTIYGVNGLFCNIRSNKLYVNGMGENNKGNGVIGYIDLKNNNFTKLTEMEGIYDGLFIYKDHVFFSNWVAFEKKGLLLSLNLFNNKLRRVEIPDLIAGPADFLILNNTIILPALLDGSLNFYKIQVPLN